MPWIRIQATRSFSYLYPYPLTTELLGNNCLINPFITEFNFVRKFVVILRTREEACNGEAI